ncbi:MAG: YgiQ family radical SAM protein [Cyanobacteriota bacterium]
MKTSFLPTNKKEMREKGWDYCDIILITGDAYIDHPSFGAALLGKYLENLNYKVGIIAQPDWNSDTDFLQLGKPKLFAGITAGNIDSMLAHYTANKKIRSDDAYTPGNKHGKRPNRATIVYSNKIKELMPGVPVVIGGIEASMRRLAHYDYWTDSIRRAIILDAKADILVYGMAEKALEEIATRIKNNQNLDNIRGTVIYKGAKTFKMEHYKESVMLPSYSELKENKNSLILMTVIVEENLNPYNAKTLLQEHNNQFVIAFPPSLPLSTEELDQIYDLQFIRKPHFSYSENIPAYEMIKDSITIMRGCAGGCSFCSLGLHQGKFLQSRSQESILNEVKNLAFNKDFKGTISDLGGPSANLYKLGCKDNKAKKNCLKPSCLYPSICSNFNTSSGPLISLMKKARKVNGIKKINISSGIRHDVAVLNQEYLSELVKNHVGGHLKLAPEHFDNSILKLMRKPVSSIYEEFSDKFYELSNKANKKQYIVPYLISSFPGCGKKEIDQTAKYLKQKKIKVEQVQEFIPLPMTVAAAMYYAERDYLSTNKIYVAKKPKDRQYQKNQLLWWKNKK